MRAFAIRILSCSVLLGAPNSSGEGQPPGRYLAVRVERGAITTLVQATGVINARFTVDVSSQLSGRIASVDVDFNDDVRAGQKIAQLDQESFVARVNEAKAAFKVAIATEKVQAAALERAAGAVSMARTMKSFAEAQAASATARQDEVERNLQRKLALVRTGSITDRDISQARSERDMGAAEIRAARDQVTLKDEAIAAAEAEQRMSEGSLENARAITEQRQALLDQARLDLERTVIRAPIGGVIIKRNITPGQTVAVSLEAKTLFQIAKDLHQMEVYGRIDEADVGMVKVGQPAAFSVDAFPDRTFAGQVIQIRKAPEVVQSVVTYTALISAPNPDLLLLPGMTASLRIVTKRVENTLYIPNPAIQFSPENADFRPRSSHAGEGHDLARSEAAVWVMQANGMPAPVVIGVGVSDGQRTQVTGGPLQEGDQVIIGQNPR